MKNGGHLPRDFYTAEENENWLQPWLRSQASGPIAKLLVEFELDKTTRDRFANSLVVKRLAIILARNHLGQVTQLSSRTNI